MRESFPGHGLEENEKEGSLNQRPGSGKRQFRNTNRDERSEYLPGAEVKGITCIEEKGNNGGNERPTVVWSEKAIFEKGEAVLILEQRKKIRKNGRLYTSKEQAVKAPLKKREKTSQGKGFPV